MNQASPSGSKPSNYEVKVGEESPTGDKMHVDHHHQRSPVKPPHQNSPSISPATGSTLSSIGDDGEIGPWMMVRSPTKARSLSKESTQKVEATYQKDTISSRQRVGHLSQLRFDAIARLKESWEDMKDDGYMDMENTSSKAPLSGCGQTGSVGPGEKVDGKVGGQWTGKENKKPNGPGQLLDQNTKGKQKMKGENNSLERGSMEKEKGRAATGPNGRESTDKQRNWASESKRGPSTRTHNVVQGSITNIKPKGKLKQICFNQAMPSSGPDRKKEGMVEDVG